MLAAARPVLRSHVPHASTLARRFSTTTTADVVVIGAGVMGLHTAFQIRRRDPNAKITVLEKGRGLGEGSSGWSSAILRLRYSLDEMVHMSADGRRVYDHWNEYTGLETPRAKLTEMPMVWMLGMDKEGVKKDVERLRRQGGQCSVLSSSELRKLWPMIATCGTPLDLSGETDHDCDENERYYMLEESAAYFEPGASLEDMSEALAREGIDLKFNAAVTSIGKSNGAAESVTYRGGTIHTGSIVNGPWCNKVNALAEVEVPFTFSPVRIQVAYKSAPDLVKMESSEIPAIADAVNGVYCRPQRASGQIVFSTASEEDERDEVDPDDFDQSLDSHYRQKYLNALHHRVPELPPRGKVTGFSALYTICKEDVHPVIGEVTKSLKNYWIANGFSGHGFKIAPAVGSMLAKDITKIDLPAGDDGRFDTSVPIEFFSPYRKPHVLASHNVLA